MEDTKIKVNADYDPVVLGRGKLNYLVVMPLYRENPKEYYQMPLGIPYVSSAMKQAGLNISTLNLNHYENPYDVLKERIQKGDIDVVLSGGLSPQYANIRAVFKHSRKQNYEIITICGGGIITADPAVAMQALEIVDYGVIGEGEITVVELCKVLQNGGNLHNVKGIVYRENNRYLVTEHREALAGL